MIHLNEWFGLLCAVSRCTGTGSTLRRFACSAKFRVKIVCCRSVVAGDTQKIIDIKQEAERLSWRTQVSGLLR